MGEARDYFLRERYAGLDLIASLPAPLDEQIRAEIEEAWERDEFPESTPADFSQELLFSTDIDAHRQFISGEIRFPFYSRVGGENFWRSQRSQAPYLERVAEIYPDLDIDLVEQLWLERGRGMPKALPAPADQKGRWRSVGGAPLVLLPDRGPAGPYAAAIVMARCGIGGAERVMRELAASIERLTGLPSLIVVADTQVDPADLPAGAICLPNMTVRDDSFLRNVGPVRAMALRDLVVQAGVPRVISINSSLGNLLLQDGALQRDGIKTASALFNIAVGPGGEVQGYVEIVDWLIDAGVTMFTDNDHMARELAQRNFYDGTVALAIPATVTAGPAPNGANVLWAGRIDSQKRPDLLIEIAQASSHITYEVWGTPLLSSDLVMDDIASQPNIVYRSGFDAFENIDLTGVGCLLYTSAYDGTPNVLLEAMGGGLACVCSAVGGVPDLMAEGRGVLVDADAPARRYVAALEALLEDRVGRERMSIKGRDYIGHNHNLATFDQQVARLLAQMQG